MYDSFQDAFVITPNDTTQLSFAALYVGGAGNITIVTAKGNSVLFSAVPAGTLLRIRGTKVMLTGTAATLIVGLI